MRYDPSMSAEDWMRAEIAAGDGPVSAVKFSRKGRLLLLAGRPGIRLRDLAGAYLLCRWGAHQHRVRVSDGRVSVSDGFIGVTAFTKRGVLRKAADR